MKKFTIRALFFILGLSILSFGVSLTIKADLGAGAWDALNVGLEDEVGLTVGTWVIIVGMVLIVSNALLAKERPDFLALITVTILGPMIDFWLGVFMSDWAFTSFPAQLAVLLFGVVFVSLGIATYIQPKLPLIPIDNFMVSVQKRFNLQITKAKTLTEAFALLMAFLFGGPIGIGTVVILFMLGPTIQFFDPKAKNVLGRLLGEEIG